MNQKRVRLSLILFLAASIVSVATFAQQPTEPRGQKEVAEYVRTRVLAGDFGDRTLWMTPEPIDPTYVVKDMIEKRKFQVTVPFPKAWLVMIDDTPKANFAHPVRWLFVDDQLTRHSDPVKRDFPPIVLTKDGKPVLFRCVSGVTPRPCEELAVLKPAVKVELHELELRGCRYAVLVSGGINSGSNYSRYPQNIRSMYSKLRGCGYPASNIYVYYADGSGLDLDNADGDNNDATGSDVTAGANEGAIRARIQLLCRRLDRKRDILFTYFTNHGADDEGACLWDGNNNGLEAGEIYSPAELAADTANCSVCRHFMLHDQCFAGDFYPLASDGNHANLAVYGAASATEVSWGREYMARWETNDPATKTMNQMHQDVVANGNLSSTPGMAEGTAGIGNVSPCTCCKRPWWSCWIWWRLCWWWWVLILVVVVIVAIAVARRRPAPAG